MFTFSRKSPPAPIRVIEPKQDGRPITIQRTPKGLLFISNETGLPIPKAEAIALMRAYKHAHKSPKAPAKPKAPKAAKQFTVLVSEYFPDGSTKTVFERSYVHRARAASELAKVCSEIARYRNNSEAGRSLESLFEAHFIDGGAK